MFCDSNMLGWSGGGKGVAAQIPDEYEVGSSPPSSKPRPKEEVESVPTETPLPGLFEKKLTKEEKKKLAEEKRKARKAAKAAKAKAEGANAGDLEQ